MFPLHDDNPTRRFPLVTYLLVATNIVAYLAQLWTQYHVGEDILVVRYGLIPAELVHDADRIYRLGPRFDPIFVINEEPAWVTVLTSMFLHGSLLHILGNMWFLAIFGNNIEDRLCHLRFLLFYLAGGVAAAATHVFLYPDSPIPTIGASGAIAGVLGGYFVLFPGARVTTLVFLGFFVTVAVMPAAVVLGFWFVMQVFSELVGWGASQGEGGGVAYAAHIGGFVFGWLAIRFMARPEPRRPRYYGPPTYWDEELPARRRWDDD